MTAQQYDAIMRRFDRIDTKLNNLYAEKKRTTWVKVSDIMKLTGWNSNKMRNAREAGTIIFKKEKGHFLYNLESLPQVFINKPKE